MNCTRKATFENTAVLSSLKAEAPVHEIPYPIKTAAGVAKRSSQINSGKGSESSSMSGYLSSICKGQEYGGFSCRQLDSGDSLCRSAFFFFLYKLVFFG